MKHKKKRKYTKKLPLDVETNVCNTYLPPWKLLKNKAVAYDSGYRQARMEYDEKVSCLKEDHTKELNKLRSSDDKQAAMNKALESASRAVDAIAHMVTSICNQH